VPGDLSTIPEDELGDPRRRRISYAITTGVLTLLMAVVVIDAFGGIDVFGTDRRTIAAEGDGYTLTLKAPSVSRPGLATPFEVRVHRAGGFDAPIELAIDRSYLQHFDYNRMYPEPSGERSRGEWVVFEFDPPDGDELIIELDVRLEPAAQSGATARVAVLEGDDVAVEVASDLRVWP
jgi:hypothetical protein